MSELYLSKGLFPADFLQPSVDFILSTQQDDGCIPWFPGAHADPWDHIEAAMGLVVAGESQAARRAYRWLQSTQLPDGSWWVAYKDGAIHDRERRETNFVAYVATGLWHFHLVTGDHDFLRELWPTVERAIGFVLSHQSDHGEIHWAVDADGTPREDALVTGCSSIHKSLECAINIAHTLALDARHWIEARRRLGDVLRHRPERFELTMALLAAGDHARAARLFSWLHQWRDGDGTYWTGYQWVEEVLWPLEKPTWTAGAVLLAADALTGHTAASRLFTEVDLLESPQQAERAHPRQFFVKP